jgi:hypothetical protein
MCDVGQLQLYNAGGCPAEHAIRDVANFVFGQLLSRQQQHPSPPLPGRLLLPISLSKDCVPKGRDTEFVPYSASALVSRIVLPFASCSRGCRPGGYGQGYFCREGSQLPSRCTFASKCGQGTPSQQAYVAGVLVAIFGFSLHAVVRSILVAAWAYRRAIERHRNALFAQVCHGVLRLASSICHFLSKVPHNSAMKSGVFELYRSCCCQFRHSPVMTTGLCAAAVWLSMCTRAVPMHGALLAWRTSGEISCIAKLACDGERSCLACYVSNWILTPPRCTSSRRLLKYWTSLSKT